MRSQPREPAPASFCWWLAPKRPARPRRADADPADRELIASGEAKTNPRVRDQIGQIALVPKERRVSGPGASWVMAPFTHVSR